MIKIRYFRYYKLLYHNLWRDMIFREGFWLWVLFKTRTGSISKLYKNRIGIQPKHPDSEPTKAPGSTTLLLCRLYHCVHTSFLPTRSPPRLHLCLKSRKKIYYSQWLMLLDAKCSTKNHWGSLSVCMSGSISFFAIYSKNLQATHTSKCVTLCNISFCGCKLVYEGAQHFWKPSTK